MEKEKDEKRDVGEEESGQHCERQRCTLPGGHSDNVLGRPPATIPISPVQKEREERERH